MPGPLDDADYIREILGVPLSRYQEEMLEWARSVVIPPTEHRHIQVITPQPDNYFQKLYLEGARPKAHATMIIMDEASATGSSSPASKAGNTTTTETGRKNNHFRHLPQMIR